MNYEVLYRKYRPVTFTDVVGQRAVTETLQNEVRDGRTANAYLFTGSRGTGKTTCARILARAVNCLNPQNGNPCCECEICRGIEDGSILDVEEIDAASNNGVNDARELIERINFPPMTASKRVFIIDEVHMLTTQAFNALLKSIEEPPENVMFILATTEVHKVLDTIKSRCQRFDFRRIAAADLAGRLEYIASKEGASLPHETAMYIARAADGGMRDAISILDRSISISVNVTDAVVTAAAGLVDRRYLFELADDFAAGDIKAALVAVDRLHAGVCDAERLTSELINHFRNLLVAKSMNDPGEILASSDVDLAEYKRQGAAFTVERILDINNILREAAADMKYSANKRVAAEIAVMKICSPERSTDVSALFARVARLEEIIKSGNVPVPAARTAVPQSAAPAAEKPAAPAQIPVPAQTPPAVETAKPADPLAGLVFEDDSDDYDDEPVFAEAPEENEPAFDVPPEENEPMFDEPPAENEPVFDEPPAENGPMFDEPPAENEPVFDEPPFDMPDETSGPAADEAGQGTEPVFDDVPFGSIGFDDIPVREEAPPASAPEAVISGISPAQWSQAIGMILTKCPGFAVHLMSGVSTALEGNVLHISGYSSIMRGILNKDIGKEGSQALKFAVDQLTGSNIDIRFD
ncbi:MAG: DNA polymerase III subunit gamma/tau [Clostridia bacterium]|nr:DNA polymerase III subunit gamma/tau [Clostridia bacterium]